MTDQEKDHTLVKYTLYAKVWLALIVLTTITVSVSYLDMKKFTVFTIMLIATIKASLVILYFMHLRYEKPMYRVMILFVLLTYATFILLTFSDYSFR